MPKGPAVVGPVPASTDETSWASVMTLVNGAVEGVRTKWVGCGGRFLPQPRKVFEYF